MSGRVLQSDEEYRKIDINYLRSKYEGPPPSRTDQKARIISYETPPPRPCLPVPCIEHKRSDNSEEECKSRCQDVVTSAVESDQDSHLYEELTIQKDVSADVSSKLRKIEDNQTRLRNELDDLRGKVKGNIVSLQASVSRVLEITNNLKVFTGDSLTRLGASIEKMHFQLLENSDHLGKQILDVRRDIMGTTTGQDSSFRPTGGTLERKQVKKYTHTFDWEVGNLNSLSKSQTSVSSQSHLIGELNFKILGGATCDKDGHLHVKMYGEFTHKPSSPWEKNCGFECSVYMMDKSGKKSDFMIGKIRSDFNSGKEWNIGDVSVNEIKDLGYAVKNGNVYLKFVIQIYA